MEKFGVQLELEALAKVIKEWAAAIKQHQSDVDTVMSRLLHEAAANRMSPEQVARSLGSTPTRVRALMRRHGLNPKMGKNLLERTAAQALHENAALLGIEPREMDLLSPLAYLPMGEAMRERVSGNRPETMEMAYHDLHLRANVELRTACAVCGKEPVPALVHGINYVDHEIACGHLAYNDPQLVTSDLRKITCQMCREVLVQE